MPSPPSKDAAGTALGTVADAARAFTKALAQLGIQPVSDSAALTAVPAAPSVQLCGSAIVPPPTATVPTSPSRDAARPHRAGDEPSTIRGPPAPLNAPLSPAASTGSAVATAGGSTGISCCAVLVDTTAPAPSTDQAAPPASVCVHAGPSGSSEGARGPPAV